MQVSYQTVKDTSESKPHMKPTNAWSGNTVKHARYIEATQASCFQVTHKRYLQ